MRLTSSHLFVLLASAPLAAFVHGCTVDATTADASVVDAFAIDGAVDANRVQIPDAGTLVDVPAPTCEPGLIDCGGHCTRVAADVDNCGSCGNACPDGVTCAVGRCDCYAPQISCDGLCSDLVDDPEHCGSCDNACAPTEFCSLGECVVMCTAANHQVCVNTDPAGTRTQVCADLTQDPMNCGSCNTRCAGGATCVDGRCACPDGQMNCGAGCVDVSTDVANCGACRNSCGAGGTCAGGACTACGTGLTACGSPSRCVDTMSSTLHCGTCGHACPGGAVCNAGACECPPAAPDMCAGMCTDLQSSPYDCGTCGHACASGAVCVAGTCQCPGAQVVCGSACVDLTTDTRNCGVCSRACATTFSCVNGACDCARTDTLCGTQCFNLQTNAANCGTCGHNCGPGGACVAGVCGCQTGLSLCDGACLDTRYSPTHCGDCTTVCGAGMVCSGGSCEPFGTFRIATLSDAGCMVVDHAGPTGDDRGGVAVSASTLFVTGDTATASMSAADLTGAATVGARHDGLVSDVSAEQIYVLMSGSGAGTEIDYSGTVGVAITQLGLLDPTTGALTSSRIPLSRSIMVGSGTAVLSGYGEALIGVPAASSINWYQILLPAGLVTQLGTTQIPTHRTCESWAWWGIAERFGGSHYGVYVESTTRIARLAIPDTGSSMAAPTAVQSFTNLGDMCSITFSTSRHRWYFHHENSSQFGGSSETAGYCPGTFDRP